MNAVGLRFRRSKSSLHACLRKPDKCGGGARLPFPWCRRRIITVINKNGSHRDGKQ